MALVEARRFHPNVCAKRSDNRDSYCFLFSKNFIQACDQRSRCGNVGEFYSPRSFPGMPKAAYKDVTAAQVGALATENFCSDIRNEHTVSESEYHYPEAKKESCAETHTNMGSETDVSTDEGAAKDDTAVQNDEKKVESRGGLDVSGNQAADKVELKPSEKVSYQRRRALFLTVPTKKLYPTAEGNQRTCATKKYIKLTSVQVNLLETLELSKSSKACTGAEADLLRLLLADTTPLASKVLAPGNIRERSPTSPTSPTSVPLWKRRCIPCPKVLSIDPPAIPVFVRV